MAGLGFMAVFDLNLNGWDIMRMAMLDDKVYRMDEVISCKVCDAAMGPFEGVVASYCWNCRGFHHDAAPPSVPPLYGCVCPDDDTVSTPSVSSSALSILSDGVVEVPPSPEPPPVTPPPPMPGGQGG